jgi:hypothetical protein
MMHSDEADDRRGADRRLSQLERQYSDLATKVDRVGLEQVHQRDLINTRFATIEKGQELVSAKVDALTSSITLMASDQGNSPAGRALTRDIVDLKQDYAKLDLCVQGLLTTKAEMAGAIAFATRSGVSAVLLAAAALVVMVLRVAKVIP